MIGTESYVLLYLIDNVPFVIQEEDAEEEGPILIMADEVYDDAQEVVSSLPERALLSDFVESLPYVTSAVEKVRTI